MGGSSGANASTQYGTTYSDPALRPTGNDVSKTDLPPNQYGGSSTAYKGYNPDVPPNAADYYGMYGYIPTGYQYGLNRPTLPPAPVPVAGPPVASPPHVIAGQPPAAGQPPQLHPAIQAMLQQLLSRWGQVGGFPGNGPSRGIMGAQYNPNAGHPGNMTALQQYTASGGDTQFEHPGASRGIMGAAYNPYAGHYNNYPSGQPGGTAVEQNARTGEGSIGPGNGPSHGAAY